jgi:hypothetical protein
MINFIKSLFKKSNTDQPNPLISDGILFDNQENLEFYLKNKEKSIYLTEDEDSSIFCSKAQIKTILSNFKEINISDYTWADVCCGRKNFAFALNELSNNKVYALDIDENSYCKGIESNDLNKVEFIKLDTDKEKIPENITAYFLRSSLGVRALKKILELNKNIKLFIIIPEGLNNNSGISFDDISLELKTYFSNVYRKDLVADICIKGSHSQHVRYGVSFPVLIAMK